MITLSDGGGHENGANFLCCRVGVMSKLLNPNPRHQHVSVNRIAPDEPLAF